MALKTAATISLHCTHKTDGSCFTAANMEDAMGMLWGGGGGNDADVRLKKGGTGLSQMLTNADGGGGRGLT